MCVITLYRFPLWQIVRAARWLLAILITTSTLFGQRGFAPALTRPEVVTVEELRHIVPEKAQKEMAKAEAAKAKGRTDEAIAHLKRAIAIDSGFIAARNNLAIHYLATGLLDSAVAELEDALKLYPQHAVLLSNLAVGYLMNEKFDAAERAARLTMKLDRTGWRAPLMLGVALVKQRKFTEEALQSLDRARDYHPWAHLFAGRVHLERGHLERAKNAIQTYLSSGDQEHSEIANSWLEVISEREQKSALAYFGDSVNLGRPEGEARGPVK